MSRGSRIRPGKQSNRPKAAAPPVFDPALFLATVRSRSDISKYSKRQVLFAQGDDADSVFYIKKVRVKVAVLSKDGKEAVIAIFWGRMSLSERVA